MQNVSYLAQQKFTAFISHSPSKPSVLRPEQWWKSLSYVWLFVTPWAIQSIGFSGQNAGVGSLFLLQEIFPTQGLNPGLLYCRRILYQLSHQWSPSILEWVAYPSSSRESQFDSWGQEDLLEKGKSHPHQYSGLENSMDYSAWGREESDRTERLSEQWESLLFHLCCYLADSTPNVSCYDRCWWESVHLWLQFAQSLDQVLNTQLHPHFSNWWN